MIIFLEDFKNPFFSQARLGRNEKIFNIYKLRTMKIETPDLESSDVQKAYYLKSASVIRKLKIDELPQFINVLLGDMSIVGPRPCLPNMKILITERRDKGVFSHKPGITGICQILNITMANQALQSSLDSKYNDVFGNKAKISENIFFYFYCILNTVIKVDKKIKYFDKFID